MQANKSIKRYLVLFFDNASMALPDQIQARAAAGKFIDANAGPDRQMAVVEFGGTLRVTQNFTANADVLHTAVKNAKTSAVASNTTDTSSAGSIGGPSLLGISGQRSPIRRAHDVAVAAHDWRKIFSRVPGRKMLVLFSAGFPLDPTTHSELLATIDACNKSNVAVYSLDVRGLMARGSWRHGARTIASRAFLIAPTRLTEPRASFSLLTRRIIFEPSARGGGGGGGRRRRRRGGGAGGSHGGGGGTGGGTEAAGGTGGKTAAAPARPGWRRENRRHSDDRNSRRNPHRSDTYNPYNPYNNLNPNNPFNQAHNIFPTLPHR